MLLLSRYLLAFSLLAGLAHAADIPGYIGSQSFRLLDDSDLAQLSRRADDAKGDFARADQARDQLDSQVRQLERQSGELNNRMLLLVREADALKTSKQALETTLTQLNTDPVANAAQITQTQNEIAQKSEAIDEKLRQAGAIKLEMGSVNVRAEQVRRDLGEAQKRAEDSRRRLQQAVSQRDDYQRELISVIQITNRNGANAGQGDGANDGVTLSQSYGSQYGSRDGDSDGLSQGTLDGQERDYRRGADQGERNGAARARIDGERDGENEGVLSGNKNAGNREGRAAGIKRGEASDAAVVGTAQGKSAGLSRAVSTGKVNGKNNGEAETTKKLESSDLSSSTVEGAFAGSFSRRAPGYPGDFNGSRFNPNVSHNKEVIRKAYADGYIERYREYTRYEYLRRIDTDYNQYYDGYYRAAYGQAIGRDYPAHYDSGLREADARAYSRDYPVIKAQAYSIAFERMNANPNRAAGEFKVAYKDSEASAYAEKYEQIKNANYVRVEAEVFAANIAEQTEIYRQKRIAEVTKVYNENAVLQFVSSEMIDGGIQGIASLDGVFQPNEKTLHSVTLRNFGFKAAQNVSVLIAGGSLVKIPVIPARSLVVIKGAADGVVGAALGATFKSSLKVVSALTSGDAVETRHFDKMESGTLKEADIKSVKVSYPLSLSGLALNSQLLKDAKNKLKVSVTNNSKRAYKGDMKVKLVINSQNNLIVKEFGGLSELQTSASLSDAEILVDQEADVYRSLSLSASIVQNGVTLGILADNLSVMAKAQYKEVAKRPVLIANSDKNLSQLLDALSEIGGTEKVSVLDLSLASLNATVLANGLSQKTLLVVDDASGSNMKSLNAFIGKSKLSSFLFIDSNEVGLKNTLALAALKDAPKILLGQRTVAFSNPHRAESVLKSSAFMQSKMSSFTNDLALAQMLTLTAPEMIALLKTRITPANFGTPNDTLKVYSLKALAEVLCINEAYDESGGIFNRDKKWPKMIEEDTSLFIHQLKAASSGDVVTSKLPMILSAIAMQDALSSAMSDRDGMKLKIRGTTNDVLDKMEDSYKKNLKKDFKELYNKAYEVASVHRPSVSKK